MTLEEKYIQHVEECFKKAENLESKISQEIKDMEGMTGEMTRHLYNNLLTMDDVRYLERLTNDDSHTPADKAKATWHNGILVYILKQTK